MKYAENQHHLVMQSRYEFITFISIKPYINNYIPKINLLLYYYKILKNVMLYLH
jgi:hypothetical protein